MLFWAVCVARVVLGLPFFIFGLNYFLKLVPMPQPSLPEAAMNFAGALEATGYMRFIKVLETVGGALVLSGRFVPLGLTILTPIAVNILLFEVYMTGAGGPGVAFTVLCALLIWAYRSHFVSVFAVRPKIG